MRNLSFLLYAITRSLANPLSPSLISLVLPLSLSDVFLRKWMWMCVNVCNWPALDWSAVVLANQAVCMCALTRPWGLTALQWRQAAGLQGRGNRDQRLSWCILTPMAYTNSSQALVYGVNTKDWSQRSMGFKWWYPVYAAPFWGNVNQKQPLVLNAGLYGYSPVKLGWQNTLI